MSDKLASNCLADIIANHLSDEKSADEFWRDFAAGGLHVGFGMGAEEPGTSVLQADLREMLQALGMHDGAQPKSPHQVFQGALAEMKARLGAPPKPVAWARLVDGKLATVSCFQSPANNEPLYATPPLRASAPTPDGDKLIQRAIGRQEGHDQCRKEVLAALDSGIPRQPVIAPSTASTDEAALQALPSASTGRTLVDPDLVQRCKELLEWSATGLLNGGSGGSVRNLAAEWEPKVGDIQALNIAGSKTRDEAMAALVRIATAHSPSAATTDGAAVEALRYARNELSYIANKHGYVSTETALVVVDEALSQSRNDRGEVQS